MHSSVLERRHERQETPNTLDDSQEIVSARLLPLVDFIIIVVVVFFGGPSSVRSCRAMKGKGFNQGFGLAGLRRYGEAGRVGGKDQCEQCKAEEIQSRRQQRYRRLSECSRGYEKEDIGADQQSLSDYA